MILINFRSKCTQVKSELISCCGRRVRRRYFPFGWKISCVICHHGSIGAQHVAFGRRPICIPYVVQVRLKEREKKSIFGNEFSPLPRAPSPIIIMIIKPFEFVCFALSTTTATERHGQFNVPALRNALAIILLSLLLFR